MGNENMDDSLPIALLKRSGWTVLIILAVFVFGIFLDIGLQYNENGVSKYIGIGISKREKEKLGELDGYTIYREDLSFTTLETIEGGSIELADAIESGQIDLKDLYKSAWWKKKVDIDGEKATVYIFENYQILKLEDECIISPKREY